MNLNMENAATNQFIHPHPLYSPDDECPDSTEVYVIKHPQPSIGSHRHVSLPSHLPSGQPPISDLNRPLHESAYLAEIGPHSMYTHPRAPLPASHASPTVPYYEPGAAYPSPPSLITPFMPKETTSKDESSCPRCKELTFVVENLEKRVQMLMVQVDKPISLNGTLTWKIADATKLNKKSFLESSVFYTSINGYKLQGCVYLNGDGEAKGRYISVYITILKGEYDGLLNWPFLSPITILLIDQSLQGNDFSKTFQPTRTSSCFRQPLDNIKRPSGLPDFFQLSNLKDPFLVDDILYLKFTVHGAD